MEYLVLEVDDARFGVPTLDVREVLRAASLGAAPARFPYMLGMLNYRGQVLGVLELDCLRGHWQGPSSPGPSSTAGRPRELRIQNKTAAKHGPPRRFSRSKHVMLGGLSPQDHLIVLQTTGRLFALRVDQAVEILTLTAADVAANQPGSDAAAADDAINAIAHPRLGVVYLLDTQALWSQLYDSETHLPTQEVEAS